MPGKNVYLQAYLSNTQNTGDQMQTQIHRKKFDQIQIHRIFVCKHKYIFDHSPDAGNDNTRRPKLASSKNKKAFGVSSEWYIVLHKSVKGIESHKLPVRLVVFLFPPTNCPRSVMPF